MFITHWLVTILIFLLGVSHCFIGIACREFDLDTLWFLGSGLAIIFAGLFNYLLVVTQHRLVKIIATAVNVLLAILFIISLSLLPATQVWIGICLFGLAIVTASRFPGQPRI
jgi:hypothetical protein